VTNEALFAAITVDPYRRIDLRRRTLRVPGVVHVDRDRRVLYWNAAAEKITGFTAEDVQGRTCHDNILNHVDEEGNELCQGRCPLLDSIDAGCRNHGHVYLRHKDGYRKPVNVRTLPLVDAAGEIVGGIELFTDLTDSRDAQRLRELEVLAAADPLTGLPNRRLFDTTLDARLAEKKRHGFPFALALVDIDHFKAFNDEHGHQLGDRVLLAVAHTLKGGCRAYDFVSRWGGEEFAILLGNVDARNAATVMNRCRKLVNEAVVTHEGSQYGVQVSIGVAGAADSDDSDSLYTRADTALYAAKRSGRNQVQLMTEQGPTTLPLGLNVIDGCTDVPAARADIAPRPCGGKRKAG
jgi:diguanylate cyclase (GGDEF)-like protein/PAS domain S-box-containing protein